MILGSCSSLRCRLSAPAVGRGVAFLVAGFVFVGLGASRSPAAERAPAWRAGAASMAITPKTEMWMAGYAARDKPSEGTAQPLYAKALAIADEGEQRLVIVTLDLIGVPRSLRQAMETRLAQAHGLRPEQFILNASHTHCGPELRSFRVPDAAATQTAAYVAELEQQIQAAVSEALRQLAPAHLTYTRARAGFAMNRRLPTPAGGYNNAPNPDGPVDHDVPVLRVEGPDKALRAVLFGYACHNTTLGFYQFAGDYAGYAQEYLEADHPGAVALFMTGCGGDQNPYPRRTLELAQYHGRALATAVEAALTIPAEPLSGRIKAAYTEIDLPYAAPPDRAGYTARLSSKNRYEVAHAERMLKRLEQEGALPKSYPYPVQVVQLGRELKLVALGGEVVVDYSLRLKRQLGGPGSVWVAGYSNDVMGYIPSERVLREGGYEGGGAMLYSNVHPGPWAAGIEERIVSRVMELVRTVAP